MAIAIAVGLVALIGAALGFHAWQLHLAEEDVRALQAITTAQHDKLQAIDLQADALAGELRDIQRQDAEIRQLLGVHSVPVAPGPSHARLASGAGRSPDDGRGPGPACPPRPRLRAAPLGRQHRSRALAHRVLNLRRLARAGASADDRGATLAQPRRRLDLGRLRLAGQPVA